LYANFPGKNLWLERPGIDIFTGAALPVDMALLRRLMTLIMLKNDISGKSVQVIYHGHFFQVVMSERFRYLHGSIACQFQPWL
jgi:hypothetical protein